MDEFAGWLVRRRKLAGLNPAAFAERIESNERTVRRWEAGEGLPTRNKLRAVARVLDEDADSLIAAVYGEGELPQMPAAAGDVRLSRFAAGRLAGWAGEAGMQVSEWLGRLVDAMLDDAPFREFVLAKVGRRQVNPVAAHVADQAEPEVPNGDAKEGR